MITQVVDQKVIDTTNKPRIQYTISAANMSKLIQQAICTYQNPIESTIREYTVNSRDAMKLYGITKPIEVTTPTSLDPHLTIRDFAGGLTEQETIDLLFSFGASGEHKQVSNDYVGGFGIGSKSAFNLANSFLFTVYRDGKRTVWNCMLDEMHQPTAAKLSETPTDEESGILVTIPHDYFDPMKAQSVLEWLDVPVNLNGQPVKKAVSYASAEGTVKNGDMPFKWWLIDRPAFDADHQSRMNWDVTFLVGCGAIPVETRWGTNFPHDIENSGNLREYMRRKLVVELPIGSVSLPPSRETMIYDDKTKGTLSRAFESIPAAIDEYMAQKVLSAKTTSEMVENLDSLYRSTDGTVFKEIVENCMGGSRPTPIPKELRPAAVYGAISAEIEFGVDTPISRVMLAEREHIGRSWYNTFGYKTTDPMSEAFRQKHKTSKLSAATEFAWWTGAAADEFCEAAGGCVVMLPSETKVDNPGCGEVREPERNKLAFLSASGFQGLTVLLYPDNAKRFTGDFRGQAKGRGASQTSKPILAMQGDVEAMRKLVDRVFHGQATIETPDVEVFKKRSARPIWKEHAKAVQPASRTTPCGWELEITTSLAMKDWALSGDPEKIVRLATHSSTKMEIKTKSSLQHLPSGKPTAAFVMYGKNRDDEWKDRAKREARDLLLGLMLSGADVRKDKHGIPAIVVLDGSTNHAHLAGRIVTREELAKRKGGDIQPVEWCRFVMWINRLASKLNSESWTTCGSRSDICRSISEATTASGTCVRLQQAYEVFSKALGRAAKKKLQPELDKPVKLLAGLFVPPKKFPLPAMPYGYGSLRGDCPLTSYGAPPEYEDAFHELQKQIPMFAAALETASSARRLEAMPDAAAENVFTLLMARNAELVRENRDKAAEKETKIA